MDSILVLCQWGKLGSDEPPVSMFSYFQRLEFQLPVKGKQPRQFSVIQSLEICKGNKRITQKWRQLWQVVVCRCSVPSVISSDHMTAFAEMLNLTTQMACTWVQFACFLYPQSQVTLIMYIAPRVKRRKMSQILVFNNAVQYLRSCKMYPLYRNLQHVVYQDWMGGTQ